MHLSPKPTRLRVVLSVLFAVALLTQGCDRGDHPGQIGNPAPVFALNDGLRAVDLRNLRGQVVLLNFWATWCAPCIEELPSLEALQQAMPQLRVVAVATDEGEATYRSYLQRRPVSLLTVFDAHGSANAMYGTFRFPESYLIDKTGVVRRKFISAQDWTSPEIEDSIRKLSR